MLYQIYLFNSTGIKLMYITILAVLFVVNSLNVFANEKHNIIEFSSKNLKENKNHIISFSMLKKGLQIIYKKG